MKRTIQFMRTLWRTVSTLLRHSSKTFIAKTNDDELDYHTISISTR